MRFSVVLMVCFFFLVPDTMADIRAHKATYDITMQKRHQGIDVQNIQGVLDYTLRHTCDGWMSDYKSDTVFATRTGQNNTVNVLSAVEAFDGTSYHYAHYKNENDQIVNDVKGTVVNGEDFAFLRFRTGENHDTKEFEKPFYFPIGHLQALLAHAKAGDNMVNAALFDGTTADHYHLVIAFLSPAKNKSVKTNRWHVDMAFYPSNGVESTPLYEMRFDLADNGILDQIQIIYPDFTLIQRLRDVKLLEKPHCD